ncbi:MAG TPA: cupin [Planctomycetaceae bacterium]|nr:cupin [Planctomycetaceae bacterium]
MIAAIRPSGTSCLSARCPATALGGLRQSICTNVQRKGIPWVAETFEIVDFAALPGIACPCGTARRGLMESESVPYSLHVTEISANARTHYHKRLTETYFILECDEDAALELNGEVIPVQPRQAVVVHPGTRHRAVGKMTVIIVASPKFDPADEWFD